MAEKLHIKNMVCPRCIAAVDRVLQELSIPVKKVELGQVELLHPINNVQREKLNDKLIPLGFELLSTQKAQLISEIKTLIIQQIHHNDTVLKTNYSNYLSEQLHHDYQYLSRLFSSNEGITINRFIVIQKIEKVKELLYYDELTTAEIADKLDYNSVAYLSNVFKKETGMTLTEFKNLKAPNHRSIDHF